MAGKWKAVLLVLTASLIAAGVLLAAVFAFATARPDVLSGHTAGVTSVQFAPDGRLLASGSLDGTVRLWQMPDRTLRRTLTSPSGGVTSVALAPDGLTLAAGTLTPAVQLWSVADGRLLRTFTGPAQAVRGVTFSPDGQSVLAAADDGAVYEWSVAQGTLRRTIAAGAGALKSVAVSPDGQTLVLGGADCYVSLWWRAEGTRIMVLRAGCTRMDHPAPVAVLSPDGQTVAANGGPGEQGMRNPSPGRVDLWRLPNGLHERELPLSNNPAIFRFLDYTYGLDASALAPDNRLVAGAYGDQVWLWNRATGAQVAVLGGQKKDITSLAFAPDGRHLAAGALDATVRLWDVPSVPAPAVSPSATPAPGFRYAVSHPDPELGQIVWAPDGQTIATNGRAPRILLWRVRDGRVLHTLPGAGGRLAFAPDSRTLAVAADPTIAVWDVATGQLLRTLAGHTANVTELAYTPDGQFLLSVADDGTLNIWQAATGQLVQTVGVGGGSPTALALAPDSRTFAVHSPALGLRLGQIGPGLLPYQFNTIPTKRREYNDLRGLTFSRDGRTLLVQKVVARDDSPQTYVNDLRLEVWRVADGTLQSTFTLPAPGRYPAEPAVTALDTAAGWRFITPDPTGQRVLDADGNSVAQLATLLPLAGLSQDRLLVTGVPNGTGLVFWQTGTWAQVARLDPSPPGWVVFSPDGRLLVCDCPDGRLQLWQAPPLPTPAP